MTFLKNRKLNKYIYQAYYQWALTQQHVNVLFSAIDLDAETRKILKPYLESLIKGTDDLDKQLTEVLGHPSAQVTPSELTLLRIGCHELQHHPKLAGLIMSECMLLAKSYITPQSCTFIHSILDNVAKRADTPPNV